MTTEHRRPEVPQLFARVASRANVVPILLVSAGLLFSAGVRSAQALPTDLRGIDYINQCAFHDVPIPPAWIDSGWVDRGPLEDPDTGFAGFNAHSGEGVSMLTYRSMSPPGTCIALNREDFPAAEQPGQSHVDIICVGVNSSKACFWESNSIDPDVVTPLSAFDGGVDLKQSEGGFGLICSNCHAGENPFVLHPGYPLSNPDFAGNLGSVPVNGLDWYDPIVPAEWPQNAGPMATDRTDGCFGCHSDPKFGGYGRFPKISRVLGGPGSNDWCSLVLENAIEQTMPPRPPYDPPGTPNHPTFQAVADELLEMCNDDPSPQIRLGLENLDFDTVQLGFSHAIALAVHNDGDAAMTVSVSVNGAANSEWSEVPTISNAVVEPGQPPIILTYVFSPVSVGAHAMEIRVTSPELSLNQIVPLTGEGVSPFPVDTSLLLDRSLSMQDDLGGRQKISAMRVAANLYAELLRPDLVAFPGSNLSLGVGDRFGAVKYNQNNEAYMPLETANAGQRISDLDIADPTKLAPSGTTGIGGAMVTANEMLLNAPPNTPTFFPDFVRSPKQVMVVLTDGKENKTPFIGEVLSPITTANPRLLIYSVGLGHSVNEDRLQEITTVTDGYHQVSDDLGGLSIFDLERFYFDIFRTATEQGLVFEMALPMVTTSNLQIPGSRIVGSRHVDSSSHAATFLVLDDPALRGFYRLDLVSPSGDVVSNGTVIAGVPVARRQADTYTIYKVTASKPKFSPEFHGTWLLKLAPRGRWYPENIKKALESSPIRYTSGSIDPIAGDVPVGFLASVATDFQIIPDIWAESFVQLEELVVTAKLTDRRMPVTDASVEATILDPQGAEDTIVLFDDGTHGDASPHDGTWTNRFSSTRPVGVYMVTFRAVAQNIFGDTVLREETRYATISER